MGFKLGRGKLSNFELRHTHWELMGLTQLLINFVKTTSGVENPNYEYIKEKLKPMAKGFKTGML